MTDPRNEQNASAGHAEEMSDQEAQRIAAEQTASTSKNADEAGKDWEGDPSDAPETL